MVFSSVTFLFFFLPAVLAAYYVTPRRFRNTLLLAASLFFYAWGAGWLVLVLIASIVANYVFGLALERSVDARPAPPRPLVLAIAIVMNVGLLGWFKYANFAVETLDSVTGLGRRRRPAVGGDPAADRHLVLHLPLAELPGRHLPRHGAPPGPPRRLRAVHHVLPAAHRRPDRAVPRDPRPARPADARRRTRSRPGSTGSATASARRSSSPTRSRRSPNAAFATPTGELRHGDRARSGSWPTRSSCTSTSAATATWRSGSRMMFGIHLPGELRPAVRLALRHRVLAALAHVAVALVPRLPVHPARRQPRLDRWRPTAT